MVVAESAEETLPQATEYHDPILIVFSEGDSAFDPTIARKLNKVAVLPLNHQKFRATAWEELKNALHSNIALVRAQKLEALARSEEFFEEL